MALEVQNSLRSKSVVRVTGNTSTLITLDQLSTNTQNEVVVSATISQIHASSDGWWKVYRGNDATGNAVIELYQSTSIPLSQFDLTISEGATSNLYVTNSGTNGTLILMLSKVANYTRDVDTGNVI